MMSSADVSASQSDGARGVASLLRRALEEHDRLLVVQKRDFDRKLSEEKAKHELDLADLKAEIAKLRSGMPDQPKNGPGDCDSTLTLGLASCEEDDSPCLREARSSDLSFQQPARSSAVSSAGKSPTRKSTNNKSLTKLKSRSNSDEQKGRVRSFVDGKLDYLVCVVIALNTVFLFVQLQLNGQRIGVDEGLTAGDRMSEGAALVFFLTEVAFNVFFVAELLTRMLVQRRSFLFHDAHGGLEFLNVFDTLVVVGTTIDLIMQAQEADAGFMNFNIFRPLRFLRLMRVLRSVNSVRLMLKLRVLLSTVACSMMALFWSIVLLFVTLLIASMFLNQAISSSLSDERIGFETRQWLFRMYGTSTRSFYTVFELTFSGGWPAYARPLVEDVSPWWSMFFFLYIVVVTFAMFRIITALFLRDTLALAANDAETAIHEKMLMQKGIADKLMAFFEQADTSGDGMLSAEEFEAMLDDPMVAAWLGLLELEVRDAMDVFNLVKQDHSMVSASEFVTGMMRIKGNARSQDVFAILMNGKQVNRDMDSLSESLANIETSLQAIQRGDFPSIREYC